MAKAKAKKKGKKASMIVRFLDGDEDKAAELRGKLTTKNGVGVAMRRRDAAGAVVREHNLSGDKGPPTKRTPTRPAMRPPKKNDEAKTKRAQAEALARAEAEITAALEETADP